MLAPKLVERLSVTVPELNFEQNLCCKKTTKKVNTFSFGLIL
jgi:hypothetical protein